jgi:hypothetical protein
MYLYSPLPSSANNDPGLLSIPELTACTMDAGLCSNWNQDTGDNFDWTLTSESTPTSNTGPSDGSGGEGAFMFIEANDQAEGAYAAITSSATGCGVYVDYHMYGGGIGSLTVSAKNAADGEDAAWVMVWTKEGDQGNSWQAATIYLSSDSYYQISAARGPGNRGDIAIDNLNILGCTLVPGQDVIKPTPGTYSNMAATADALHILQAVVSDTPALGHTFTESNQGAYTHKYTLSPLGYTRTSALFILCTTSSHNVKNMRLVASFCICIAAIRFCYNCCSPYSYTY